MTSAEVLVLAPDPGIEPLVARVLAQGLEAQGVPVRGRRVVAAEAGDAGEALRQAVAAGGLVVCLGVGEGADLARQALAALLEVRLVLNSRVLEALEAAYASRGQAMPRRAERLALVPQGATVLMPPGVGEPGLLAETAGVLVALLPDDAPVAAALVREHLVGRLGRSPGAPGSVVRTLRLVGLDLGEVEARLGTVLRGVDGVSGRAIDADGEVWARLQLRGAPAAVAEDRFRELAPALRAEFGLHWYGHGDEPLEAVVGRLLKGRGLTVALAESCTGGLVGHRLTEVPGSSAYLERGVVAYSNAAKQRLLGVPEEVLTHHGAVSAECAAAMARGVRTLAGTDLGLSVTGIAGPEGGTPAKPVGLVFLGLADAADVRVHRHRFDRDRAGNKWLSATMALDLLRRYCLGSA